MSNTQTGKHASSGEIAIKSKRPGKKVAIVIGIVIAILLVVYLAGVAIFSKVFFPNTYVSDVDVSLQTADSVASRLDSLVGDYTFKIEGQGLDLTVTAAQAGLSVDSQTAADSMLSDQNAWEWPVAVFQKHDDASALNSALSASGLAAVIDAAVATRNESAVAPTNATVKFDATSDSFVIVPEAAGTTLDSAKVLNTVVEGALALKPVIKITTDDLQTPTILSTNPALLTALGVANADLDKTITITYNGSAVAQTDRATLASWITVSPELAVTVDSAAVDAWIADIAAKFNTVGATRTYTRPDGKVVTVSGGDYGWQVDTDSLMAELTTAVESGTSASIEMTVWQSADVATTTGNRDFGNRYIDVDLTEQHARFYDENGSIIWEADIVSGEGNTSHATPQGTWSLNLKQSPSTLIGEMTSSGVPEYETVVQYWMPFEGNAVGFHDATWQSAFGGTRYLEGYGSHGCINLSLDNAAALYDLIKVGDVVVVHS